VTLRSGARRLIDRTPTRLWLIIQSAAAFVAVFGAQLAFDRLRSPTTSTRLKFSWVAITFAGALLYYAVFLFATRVREKVFPRYPEMIVALTREMEQVFDDENRRDQIALRNHDEEMREEYEMLRRLLQAIQRVMDNSWTKPRFGERATAEVALMTRSYRDGEVTCGAWALRKPKSLQSRLADASVYKDTEAAKLYALDESSGRRSLHLVQDTSDRKHNYVQINEGEQLAIGSSVLQPIYDPEASLLGFVVAHTERRRVFAEIDADFWAGFMGLTAPHIARHLIRIRSLVAAGASGPW
jgi:hypothetical protein